MLPRMKFLIALIAFTVVLRLVPYLLKAYDITIDQSVIFYPWNFMPLTAVCLYSGAYFTGRRVSYWLPLLGLFISDLSMSIVTGHLSWGFPSDRWSAYLSYVLIVAMGYGLNRESWPLRGVDGLARGIVAEVVFFGVTNLAYFFVQTQHPQTVTGLLACYAAAIPFAKTAFISTAFYSVLLFSPLAVRAAAEESVATSGELQPAVSR